MKVARQRVGCVCISLLCATTSDIPTFQSPNPGVKIYVILMYILKENGKLKTVSKNRINKHYYLKASSIIFIT